MVSGRCLVGWALLVSALLASAGVAGCGRALYSLPDPPPREDWQNLNASDIDDRQGSVERFIAAKRVGVELYAALTAERWDEALEMMSQETRNFLEDASNGKGAAGALAAGELALGGQVTRFRPAADLFIADLVGLKDTLPNAPMESETKLRKELYAVNARGQARKVLFIYEADAWRFHSPFVGTPILAAP
jgi:hypothetical protein